MKASIRLIITILLVNLTTLHVFGNTPSITVVKYQHCLTFGGSEITLVDSATRIINDANLVSEFQTELSHFDISAEDIWSRFGVDRQDLLQFKPSDLVSHFPEYASRYSWDSSELNLLQSGISDTLVMLRLLEKFLSPPEGYGIHNRYKTTYEIRSSMLPGKVYKSSGSISSLPFSDSDGNKYYSSRVASAIKELFDAQVQKTPKQSDLLFQIGGLLLNHLSPKLDSLEIALLKSQFSPLTKEFVINGIDIKTDIFPLYFNGPVINVSHGTNGRISCDYHPRHHSDNQERIKDLARSYRKSEDRIISLPIIQETLEADSSARFVFDIFENTHIYDEFIKTINIDKTACYEHDREHWEQLHDLLRNDENLDCNKDTLCSCSQRFDKKLFKDAIFFTIVGDKNIPSKFVLLSDDSILIYFVLLNEEGSNTVLNKSLKDLSIDSCWPYIRVDRCGNLLYGSVAPN